MQHHEQTQIRRIPRALLGGQVDLAGNLTNHADYVNQVTLHARALQANGYLLEQDADEIILRAMLSNIGNP